MTKHQAYSQLTLWPAVQFTTVAPHIVLYSRYTDCLPAQFKTCLKAAECTLTQLHQSGGEQTIDGGVR